MIIEKILLESSGGGNGVITTNRSGRNLIWLRPEGGTVDIKTVDRVIDAALSNIRSEFPQWFRYLESKDIFYTDHPKIDTMATNGHSFFINPAWVERTIARVGSVDASTGKFDFATPVMCMEYVLIHEVMHIVYGHCSPKTIHKPNQDRENRAMDYQVNYYIENHIRDDYKGMTEKMNGCYDENFKNLPWQTIYNQIPDKPGDDTEEVQKTSDLFKEGFRAAVEGYRDYLKSKGLIEHYEID